MAEYDLLIKNGTIVDGLRVPFIIGSYNREEAR